MNVTTYFGAHARFRCFHGMFPVYTWYINGLTLFDWENQEHNESCSHGYQFDEEEETNNTLLANVHVLVVRDSPRECNRLQIECGASTILENNMATDPEKSRPVILMLEGKIHTMTNNRYYIAMSTVMYCYSTIMINA